MKLIKYFFWVLMLMGSLAFLLKFNELNQFEGNSLMIKIPFFTELHGYESGFKVWQVLLLTLTSGVVIGFILALFQIFSQKKELFSLNSKVRRLKVELDNLRNQNIIDEVELIDEINENNL